MAEASIIEQEYEMVPTGELVLHPRNPNQGDVGLIIESMKYHGFYGVLYAQRSTRHVVAGNHRLQAARELGFDQVPVVWMDIDDEQADRILLVDNEATRKGSNDEAALAEMLQALAMTDDGLAGTGFDGDDLDALLKEATEPVKLTKDKWVVSTEVEDEETGQGLVEKLAGAGFEAKLEKR